MGAVVYGGEAPKGTELWIFQLRCKSYSDSH
jgi:hypothetical protein